MKQSRGTEALIALEDAASDVLFGTIPGTDIMLWPLIRWPIARSMAAAELNSGAVRRSVTRTDLIIRKVRQHLPNPYASSRLRSPADALFIVDGGTYASTPTGRKNWFIDDHAAALDSAVVLQDLPIDLLTPRGERPLFSSTFSFEDAAARVRDRSRSHPPSDSAQAFVTSTLAEIYAQLDFPVDEPGRREAERNALVRLARAPHTIEAFDRILDLVQPRMVFVQTGSYGDRSHLIARIKAGGAHVAEHQHGWIGPSHGAYNFGAAMRSAPLAAALPDTLLTFGDFWSDRVRFAGEKIAVGKPHLEQAALAHTAASDRDPVVMVVSSVYDRDEVSRFTLQLRDFLPASWRVTLRPHPRERSTVAQLYPALANQPRVSFDLEPDVYESLGTVRGVIGLASTVLYEALALGCEVHIKDSPLADLYIEDDLFGERITDEASLQRAVTSIVGNSDRAVAPYSAEVRESVWKSDSIENLRTFTAKPH